MSMRYKGAVISATPPTLSPNAGGSGAWTLEQQMQANAAGLWPKNGPFNYIEDVFSTFLYTGTGVAQTITNGIDLAGKGGLVWIKQRSGTGSNGLIDTARGRASILYSNTAGAATTDSSSTEDLTSFNSNGFSLGSQFNFTCNSSGQTFASWTFEKQAKFFDVVTYTGDGNNGRTIAHNLGSTPGFVIIKKTDSTGNWMCWHNSFASTDYIALNTTGAKNYAGSLTNIFQGVNSTTVTVGSDGVVNSSVNSYVMYVFAHNAGGFGLSGNENVISCGSFTTTSGASGTFVDVGFEPQWILTKRTNSTGDWAIIDNMRGSPVDNTANVAQLFPNSSNAELTDNSYSAHIQSTGFNFRWINNTSQFIYIAIRRGPMAVPTTGTSVFTPIARTGTNAAATVTGVGFPVDFGIFNIRSNAGYWNGVLDRLRGVTQQLVSSQTNAEVTRTGNIGVSSFASNSGLSLIADDYGFSNENGPTYIQWLFGRAPGFFDEVCYTGAYNGSSAQTVTHNLGVSPELMIFKRRSRTGDWWSILPSALGLTKYLQLNSTAEQDTFPLLSSVSSSAFAIGTGTDTLNESGSTYVAYLFASAPGVSKVGSYTGTGATQVINCGFTGGARFVLIKATSTTGNWLVWDSARGIVAGNDPYLALNSTAAEVTGTDWVDTAATGFELSNAGGNLANSSGVSYIFWAVA